MTKFEDIGVDLNKVKVQLPSEWPNLLLIGTLYYYMRNFCNLIGLEQWYFSLIWNTYMWKLQPFVGSSINK